MPGSSRLGRADALALLTLVGTAMVIALPILRGGYFTYVDNSVHLAEIFDLAQNKGNGWSEIGFAGFPLATLHSPLWYPLLAWLVRHGAPLDALYASALVAGFVAPSLAVYGVARLRMSAARAAVLAYLVLVQYAMIWGIGSPLGGMWTNALASAMLIVLAELYARPVLSPRAHLAAAALLALAVLTHLFVLPLVAILAAITTLVHAQDGTLTRSEVLRRAGGWTVAAAASAKYWLTFFLVGNPDAAPLQSFRPSYIAARLLLPADPMYLIDQRLPESIRRDLHFTDAIPVLGLIGLGVYGFVAEKARRDALGRTGFWLASSLLGLLVVHYYFPLKFLGPVSWRLIDWIRFGMAFSAMGPLSALSPRWFGAPSRGAAIASASVLVSLGSWWSIPLARDIGPSVEDQVSEVRPLWTWLHDNARPEWGRIYLQDTFGWLWSSGGLAQSHLLSLTARYVGMPQLGTYYGIVPYGLRWTISEFNSLFTTRDPPENWVLEAMEKTNAGVLVTSSEELSDLASKMTGLELLHRAGPFLVFRRKGAESRPVAELTPANHLTNVDFRTGDVRFDLKADFPRTRLLVRTLYHPWWHIEGLPGAWLRESPEGFLAIDDVPNGEFSVHLWYEPSRLPDAVSALGWVGLVAWLVWLGRGERREREPAATPAS